LNFEFRVIFQRFIYPAGLFAPKFLHVCYRTAIDYISLARLVIFLPTRHDAFGTDALESKSKVSPKWRKRFQERERDGAIPRVPRTITSGPEISAMRGGLGIFEQATDVTGDGLMG